MSVHLQKSLSKFTDCFRNYTEKVVREYTDVKYHHLFRINTDPLFQTAAGTFSVNVRKFF